MKSIVGLVLGIVGGICSLCISIFLFAMFFAVKLGKSALIGNTSETLIAFASSLTMWLMILAIWFLIFGIMGVVFSSMMNKEATAGKGAIGCIVSGVLSVNLFLVIGGIMGVVADHSREEVIYEG